MFCKIASGFALVLLTSTATATAADQFATGAPVAVVVAAEQTESVRPLRFDAAKATTRGTLLPSLYLSFAGLNVYDGYSTTTGIGRGAKESNGVLLGGGSPAAIWALKGGMTVGSILVSERLWRSGHRAQAIGMMLASNVLMAAVGAHNSSVLRNQR